jgi:ABC-type uncharacterized transport system substrate-binding protein
MLKNRMKRALAAIADQATVATTAIVEHPALDAARDGLGGELAAGGYEVGKRALRRRVSPVEEGFSQRVVD